MTDRGDAASCSRIQRQGDTMRTAIVKWAYLVVFAGLIPTNLPAQQAKAKFERPQILQGALKAGDAAPEFTLKNLEGAKTVKLADLKGKPTVLVFGSCTCPPFVGTTQA